MAKNSAGLEIDTSSFHRFARDLRQVAPDTAKRLRGGLAGAGDIVAAEARARASFSTRIPRTIKVRRSGLGVRIVAGGEPKPHRGEAKAYEHHGLPGPVRHPVFGNRAVWSDKNTRAKPYLAPALAANRHVALDAARTAIRTAFREAGFR